MERENRECNIIAIRFEMGMKLSLDVMNKSGIRNKQGSLDGCTIKR